MLTLIAEFSISSYELGSDGFGSPGSLLGKPGFHFLPYGVRTPDSIMSTGSRDWWGSNVGSSAYGAGWKLPDKTVPNLRQKHRSKKNGAFIFHSFRSFKLNQESSFDIFCLFID